MQLIYDFRVAPNSFDFATYLANGFLYSRLQGKKITSILFVAHNYRKDFSWQGDSYSDCYLERKAETVAFALAQMFIDRPSLFIMKSFNNFLPKEECVFPPGFDPIQVPESATSGASLLPVNERQTNLLYGKLGVAPHIFECDPDLQNQCVSRYGERYVTLTLRNSNLNILRNDRLELTHPLRLILRDMLREMGIHLVLIPDRENFEEELSLAKTYDVEVDLASSFSLRHRHALYSRSILNLTPATGANIILVFSDHPYFMYGVFDPSVPIMTKEFFDRKGPDFLSQRPWANDFQITDWTERRILTPQYLAAKVVEIVARRVGTN